MFTNLLPACWPLVEILLGKGQGLQSASDRGFSKTSPGHKNESFGHSKPLVSLNQVRMERSFANQPVSIW